jgi:hypothetical protein
MGGRKPAITGGAVDAAYGDCIPSEGKFLLVRKKALPRHPNLVYKIGYDDVLRVQDCLDFVFHSGAPRRRLCSLVADAVRGCANGGLRLPYVYRRAGEVVTATVSFQTARKADEG